MRKDGDKKFGKRKADSSKEDRKTGEKKQILLKKRENSDLEKTENQRKIREEKAFNAWNHF